MESATERYEDLPKEGLILIIVEQQHEIEKLRQHLVNAQKAKFGTKSERLVNDNQQDLFPLEELTEPAEQEPPPTVSVRPPCCTTTSLNLYGDLKAVTPQSSSATS